MTKRRLTLCLLLPLMALAAAACGGAGDDRAATGDAARRAPTRLAARPLAPQPTATPVAVAATGPTAPPTADPAVVSRRATDLAVALAVADMLASQTISPTPTLTPRPTPRYRASAPRRVPTRRPRPTARSSSSSSRPEPTDPPRSGEPEDTAVPAPGEPTSPPQPTSPPVPTEDPSVLAALRRGELVIYLRHTRTDWSVDEREWVEEVKEDPSLFAQCDRQRQLNDDGRSDARAIGDTFRRLGIPVGRVLTSAWCRTRETADLAFGRGQVARDKIWDTGYLDDGSSERKGYRDALRRLLGEVPGGGNTVIVGHMPQLYDATSIQLEESEAALFRPKGGSYDVLVRRVGPGGWDGLGGQ